MKRLWKHATSILLLAVMLFTNVMTVRADGTTTLYLSTNDNIGVGDSVSVTIKATDSDTITVKYTDSVLKFESCSVDSSTDGNSIQYTAKEATIKFSGAAEGKANIIVTPSVLTGSSAMVIVSGGASAETQQDQPEEQPQEQPENVEEAPISGSSFSGNGVGTITVTTPEAPLAAGFVETSLTNENGEAVTAYHLADVDSPFYYFYGTSEDGNTSWFVYDSTYQTLGRADTSVVSAAAVSPAENEATEDVEEAETSTSLTSKLQTLKIYKFRRLIAVIFFLIVVALMIVINIRLKKSDDEYDDDDDFFEEYGEAQESSDALETTSKRRKHIVEDEPVNHTVSTVEKNAPTKTKQQPQPVEINNDFDLSDAIIKQVTKPSKKDEDDLTIIDFNDL